MVVFFLLTVAVSLSAAICRFVQYFFRDKTGEKSAPPGAWKWKLKLFEVSFSMKYPGACRCAGNFTHFKTPQVLVGVPPAAIAFFTIPGKSHDIPTTDAIRTSDVVPYVAICCTSLFLLWQLLSFTFYVFAGEKGQESHLFYRNWISMIVFLVIEGLIIIPPAVTFSVSPRAEAGG